MELFNNESPTIPVQNTPPVRGVVKLKKQKEVSKVKTQRCHKIGCYPLKFFVGSIFCLFPIWDKNFAQIVQATPPAYYYSGYYPCWRLFDLLLLTKSKALKIKGKMDVAKAKVEKAVAKAGGWEQANQLIEKIDEFVDAGEYELAKQLIKASFGYYSFINDLRNSHLSYPFQNGLNVFEQSEVLEKYLDFLDNLPALYESFPPADADEQLAQHCEKAGYIHFYQNL